MESFPERRTQANRLRNIHYNHQNRKSNIHSVFDASFPIEPIPSTGRIESSLVETSIVVFVIVVRVAITMVTRVGVSMVDGLVRKKLYVVSSMW